MLPSTTLTLQITQQFAKLGLDFEKAKLEIRQPHAELQIEQKPAKMTIDQGPGVLEIDGEDARAALGHKTFLRMNADIAAQARQVALEATGDIAAEGDQLAQINGPTIADLALQHQDMGPMPIDDAAPPSPVHLSYTPHPTHIDWVLGGAEITAIPHPPEISYTPGAVHPYVMQKNWIHIDVKGKYMDMTF
jgi:hypothetical protein